MKTIVSLFAVALLVGCAGPNPYQQSTVRMQQASSMNTAIVNNAIATMRCPPGYQEAKNDVHIDKRVWSEYREEIGGRRSNTYFPRAEHDAGDRTRGDGRLKCERVQ